jgi:hypothetical protein
MISSYRWLSRPRISDADAHQCHGKECHHRDDEYIEMLSDERKHYRLHHKGVGESASLEEPRQDRRRGRGEKHKGEPQAACCKTKPRLADRMGFEPGSHRNTSWLTPKGYARRTPATIGKFP